MLLKETNKKLSDDYELQMEIVNEYKLKKVSSTQDNWS